jgi:hypothetical protein
VRLVLLLVLLQILCVSAAAQQRQHPTHKPIPPATRLQQPSPSAGQANQQDQHKSAPSEQYSNSEQRGTEDRPIFVQELPAKQTPAERTQEEQDRRDKASADRWALVFAGALVAVSFFQFLALIGQAIVFWIQAKALRESVDLTRTVADRQERDMQASIMEAGRAAGAMEGVAHGIGKMATDQREFWQRQMRPYLSVRFGSVVLQDRETNYRFEVRMILVNTGHTPAHNVSYNAKADILPSPLAENFMFEIPESPAGSAGVLGPQQVFIISASVDRMYSDEEIAEISTGSTRRLYMYGAVNYTDAFGVNRYTNFSQRVEWLRGGNFMGFNSRRHNDAN